MIATAASQRREAHRPAIPPPVRWGGAAGIVAAALIIPGWVSSVLEENEAAGWLVILGQTALMLAVVAIYAAEAPRLRRMGHIGFTLTVVGNMFAVAGMTTSLAIQAKLGQTGMEHFVESGKVLPHVVAMSVLATLFMLGLLLFGAATARAGVFSRRAGQLVAAGAVVAFAGAAPDITGVEAAGTIALSVGIAWMGWALWRSPIGSRTAAS